MFEILMTSGRSTLPSNLPIEYLGELTSTEFITATQWASIVGFSLGTMRNDSTSWIVMKDHDGITKIFPKLPIRQGISWASYNTAGLISGKIVTIKGRQYKSRIIETSGNWNSPNNEDDEYNRLIYAISVGRPAEYTGVILHSYSNTELYNGWNMTGTTQPSNTANFYVRGNPIVSAAAISKSSTPAIQTWFKPLLELID